MIKENIIILFAILFGMPLFVLFSIMLSLWIGRVWTQIEHHRRRRLFQELSKWKDHLTSVGNIEDQLKQDVEDITNRIRDASPSNNFTSGSYVGDQKYTARRCNIEKDDKDRIAGSRTAHDDRMTIQQLESELSKKKESLHTITSYKSYLHTMRFDESGERTNRMPQSFFYYYKEELSTEQKISVLDQLLHTYPYRRDGNENYEKNDSLVNNTIGDEKELKIHNGEKGHQSDITSTTDTDCSMEEEDEDSKGSSINNENENDIEFGVVMSGNTETTIDVTTQQDEEHQMSPYILQTEADATAVPMIAPKFLIDTNDKLSSDGTEEFCSICFGEFREFCFLPATFFETKKDNRIYNI